MTPDRRTNRRPATADVVVIGAGVFGTSVAWNLVRRGLRVTLLDRFDVGSQTTSQGAGQTQQIRFDPATSHLAIRSLRLLESFGEETGQPLALSRCGSIKLALSSEAADQVRDEVRRGRELGIDIEEIDGDEVRRRASYVDPRRTITAWSTATDVHLPPAELARGYAQAATELGARILVGESATGIRRRNGRIVGVVTDRTSIAAPIVVNAVGAWARAIGAMVGLRLPILPVRHQLIVTRPIPSVAGDGPIIRVIDSHIYVRPEGGGLLMSGSQHEPEAVDPSLLRGGVADLEHRDAPMRQLIADAVAEFPVLQRARIARIACGMPTMTPDGLHIFDRPDEIEGLFLMCGCVRGGVSISPAAGEAMAGWIAEGSAPPELSAYRLSRFRRDLDDDEIERACLDRYRRHYRPPD